MKALLIDDDETFAGDLRLMLPEEVTMEHAMSSRRGLELAGASAPDVVFVDLHLPPELTSSPDEEGIELLRRLAAAQTQRRIVVVSAFLNRALERECLASGAALCLRKPIAREAIEAALRVAA